MGSDVVQSDTNRYIVLVHVHGGRQSGHGGEQVHMAPSPLAVKRRRETERPPGVGSSSRNSGDTKDKKKKGSESKFTDFLYKIIGFLWYTLAGLWRKPRDYQEEARIILNKGHFTPGEFVLKVQRTEQAFGTNPPQKVTNQDKTFRGELRNVGQQEVYETLEQSIKSKGVQGLKGYFLVTRLGYDTIAVDPDQMIPHQNW